HSKLRLVALRPPLGVGGVETDASANLVVGTFERFHDRWPVLDLLLATHFAQKEVAGGTGEDRHVTAPFCGRTRAILPYSSRSPRMGATALSARPCSYAAHPCMQGEGATPEEGDLQPSAHSPQAGRRTGLARCRQ